MDALGDEHERLVDAALGSSVDRLRDGDTAVLQADRLLTGGAVLHRGDEHLDGVLARAVVDDVERLADDIGSLFLLAGVVLVLHQAVDEPLDDGDLGLLELLAGVTAHRVCDRRDGDVPLGARVGVLDTGGLPLTEQLGVGVDVGTHCYRTGLSALPRTSSISETPFTFSTL